MGNSKSKSKLSANQYEQQTVNSTKQVAILKRQAEPSLYGRHNCRCCWFANTNLIKCSDHYICLKCLNIMLGKSSFCDICGEELPTSIVVPIEPSAPPPED
ncbi:Z protein [Sabia virus]|uniref:RING finger protein Z n=2 Tax=Sabia mammarenavirus (isolate Human/Brasil/SPH114202/1990) TaxID=3052299 RepID=Z_SABVB|nr:Z protein [Sabia virus]Q6UY62.1 RecName: Full=RING finger protein Z; Short=Protein Z; AltName: Full=Zinc-binding protein [Mammarenavirus brazilense]AAQ55262.1 Z protein [Sabia virus]ABY59837.1 Z protein [Sabia virus]AFA53091.1 RING finger Z protein [Sabia virus]